MITRSLADLDVIVEPRYDTATIPAAGVLQLTFFAVPLNAGQTNFAGAGVAKTLADTNMDLAAQLPAGYNFLITGFRAQPHFQLTGTDARLWSSGAWFTFTIGSKPYLRTPLDTIPAGVGPWGYAGAFDAATSAAGRGASHGWPSLSNSFGVGRKPFLLEQTANFGVLLNWTVLQPVTTGGGTAVIPTQFVVGLPVRIFMDGILRRRVQ